MRPRVQYVKSNNLNIAYQVAGDGPIDIIYVPGWVSNIDYSWTPPRVAHVYKRLSSFARLMLFDERRKVA